MVTILNKNQITKYNTYFQSIITKFQSDMASIYLLSSICMIVFNEFAYLS